MSLSVGDKLQCVCGPCAGQVIAWKGGSYLLIRELRRLPLCSDRAATDGAALADCGIHKYVPQSLPFPDQGEPLWILLWEKASLRECLRELLAAHGVAFRADAAKHPREEVLTDV